MPKETIQGFSFIHLFHFLFHKYLLGTYYGLDAIPALVELSSEEEENSHQISNSEVTGHIMVGPMLQRRSMEYTKEVGKEVFQKN